MAKHAREADERLAAALDLKAVSEVEGELRKGRADLDRIGSLRAEEQYIGRTLRHSWPLAY